MNRTFASAISLGGLVWVTALTGCQSGNVGGRKHEVMLTSEPPGAVAYLVRWSDWIEAGEEASALDDEAFRRKHRVTEQPTPVTVRVPGYSYVVIVERNGKREVSRRFTPGEDKAVHVTIGEP